MIRAAFALLALLPAAFGTGPAAARTLTMAICTGDGVVRTVEVPLGGAPEPAPDKPCCNKGCHSSCSRKRSLRAN